jgi:hypothetical protein
VIYIVSEFLVFLAALTLLFFLGTCVVILLILARVCGEWSVRRFKQATQRANLSLPPAVGLAFSQIQTALSPANRNRGGPTALRMTTRYPRYRHRPGAHTAFRGSWNAMC